MKTIKTQNEFDFIEATTTVNAEGRKLGHTAELIAKADVKALELMKFAVSLEDAEKARWTTELKAGDVQDMFNWFTKLVDEDQQREEAQFLLTATTDELARLLESRRSDRSKLKKKGTTSSYVTCQKYLGAVYAEMLVRLAMDKPYNANAAEEHSLDVEDMEAVKRKVKSLQSKKCRLAAVAKYDPQVQLELDDVVAEIDRLNSLRPNVSTKVTVKSADAETIRMALSQLNIDKLDVDTLNKLKVAGLI